VSEEEILEAVIDDLTVDLVYPQTPQSREHTQKLIDLFRAAWQMSEDFEAVRGDYTGRGPLSVHPVGVAIMNLARQMLESWRI
jgi:hypothetical protein